MKNNKWIILGIIAILFMRNRNQIKAQNGTGFGGGSGSY